MRRPARSLLSGLAAVSCCLVAAAPASALEKAIWGPIQAPSGASAFPVYKQLGVTVYQTRLLWSDVAQTRPAVPRSPRDPAYHWPAEMDAAVRGAARNGIKLAVMIQGSPPWANGGHAWNWAPDRPGDFADFATAVARRYPTVHLWMIWGEPGRTANFQPLPENSPEAPRRYALLLDAAFGALKAETRRNTVIGGMTFTVGDVLPADWVRWMRMPSGRPPRMNWWGHNPYATRFPNLALDPYATGVRDISDIDTLYAEIADAYRGVRVHAPQLWLSEFSISSDHANRAFSWYVSRAAQARWVTAAFRLAHQQGHVAGLGWYDAFDEPPGTPGQMTTGLLTSTGKPKPAFYAYRRAS